MSQELFNYLSNELGATALESNLKDIKQIVKSEYKNSSLHNVKEQAIVVYAKSNGKIVYFRIFDYPDEEFEAKVQFDRLMNDFSIGEYRMMTIDRFSQVIEEGCRDVVGQIERTHESEQLFCCCDNPNGFKEMEQGRGTCSVCKKPY